GGRAELGHLVELVDDDGGAGDNHDEAEDGVDDANQVEVGDDHGPVVAVERVELEHGHGGVEVAAVDPADVVDEKYNAERCDDQHRDEDHHDEGQLRGHDGLDLERDGHAETALETHVGGEHVAHVVSEHLGEGEGEIERSGGRGQTLPCVPVGPAVPTKRAVDPDSDAANAFDEIPHGDGRQRNVHAVLETLAIEDGKVKDVGDDAQQREERDDKNIDEVLDDLQGVVGDDGLAGDEH
ncbi:hypothetical protein EGW08_006247, partial [Elysia chlorotica]